MAKSLKLVAALIVFFVAFGLAFMGLSYANNLTPTTEGMSAFFALFMGVWISTFF